MSKRCAVNFADSGWYLLGQARLRQSLIDHGFSGGVLLFQSADQLGCPPHSEVPYAFKAAAINRAVSAGYTTVLWCDASVWAVNPLDVLFEQIEQEGHVFFLNVGHNCAQWTSDACLAQMQFSRDEAEKIPQLDAKCMGFNLANARSAEFLRCFSEHAKDGSFKGSASNESGQASADPRCRGHRWDQAVASLLAHRLQMSLTERFYDWTPNAKEPVVLTCGSIRL